MLSTVLRLGFLWCSLLIRFRGCRWLGGDITSSQGRLQHVSDWSIHIPGLRPVAFWLKWSLPGFSNIKLLFYSVQLMSSLQGAVGDHRSRFACTVMGPVLRFCWRTASSKPKHPTSRQLLGLLRSHPSPSILDRQEIITSSQGSLQTFIIFFNSPERSLDVMFTFFQRSP